MTRLRTVLLLPLLLLAGGCVQLSSSSSIRVDVEVYKGPLSREPSVQMAELMALWREFAVSIDGYLAAVCGAYVEGIENEVLRRVSSEPVNLVRNDFMRCHKGGPAPAPQASPPATTPVAATAETKSTAAEALLMREPEAPRELMLSPQRCAGYQKAANLSMIESESCFYLAQVYADALDLKERIASLKPYGDLYTSKGTHGFQRGLANGKLTDVAETFLNDVATLAMHMKFKAYYWALGQVSFPVYDRMARAVVNNFATLNSEYANQLGARADALLRQGKKDGPSAALLAQSIYLRDSQPTDFLNLYTWNRAVYPALIEDVILHPVESLSSEETSTRVRAFERLYADHYWSRINTVNANGDGEVRMALIKDEIGNWNLKSFDSDPTKLLQAYTSGALSLIGKAVDTATSGANPAGATGLLALASNMAFPGGTQGPAASAPAGDPVGVLNRTAVQRLNKAYADGAARLKLAATEETAAKENARRKLEAAEKESTSCVEGDLPQAEPATLAGRMDLLLAQVLVGAAEARAKSAPPAATAQLLKVESAVGEIRRQSAGVTEGSDEQKLLCAKALAAKSRLEAANAYAEAAAQAGQAKKSRERTIAEWKSILAEHARAVIALSEAATAADSQGTPATQKVKLQTARE